MNSYSFTLRRPALAGACLAAALAAPAALAHVALETPHAPAGSSYKAAFRVGHGCAGSPTNEFIVELPAGVQGAKPMPKPGWRLEIERSPLPRPYKLHGRTISEDVSRVRWIGGPLPDAQFDEFALLVRLPEQPGPLYWKVSQVCEQGRIDWHELPAAGGDGKRPESPAVRLEILPAAGAGHGH